MTRLTINLATRGRPELLRSTIEQTLGNIVLPQTMLMVSVDEDDEPSRKAAMEFFTSVSVSVKPREDSFGAKYNRMLAEAPADVYMAMVDYAPVTTKGFDAKVVEASERYTDGYAVIHGPFANLSFPCLQGVTHKLAAAMGGMYPEYFPYWFVDHWLSDIGQMIDRIVFANILSDFWSRRPGTMERREPGFWGSFYDAMAPRRESIAQSIIDRDDFLDCRDRKLALPRNFPLVRQHSAMINEHCRINNDAWDDKTRDERYARIKANAVRVLEEITGAAKAA